MVLEKDKDDQLNRSHVKNEEVLVKRQGAEDYPT
jgi:hypothetical protein